MARLHEYQGKELLRKHKISVPLGATAQTPEEVHRLAGEIAPEVVIKGQAWVTARAEKGLVKFAANPNAAAEAANAILTTRIDGLRVDTVLVEQKLPIKREFYAGLIVDDREQAPVMIFSSIGGTGIEEIAREHPESVARQVIDIRLGLRDFEARDLVRRTGIGGRLQRSLAEVLVKLWEVARAYDARAAEINPLVLTSEGKLVAADCRVTVDDYAVFRHKDLGIAFARELDRPPTELERIAYAVEAGDYRGTFYFIQMVDDFERGEGVVGFHGAGGGGSMMSMDAVINEGFRIANFVDTSGNPPASKVYRAARIILSQGPIDGYFGSGSGVASQEQFHSARGLVKAFLEEPLMVPAVIRLGGNSEDKAVEILERVNDHVPAPVEGYKKDDPPHLCAQRLDALIEDYTPPAEAPQGREKPAAQRPYTFKTVTGGTVTYDHAICATCESKVCVKECVPQILELNDEGCPELNITAEEAEKGRCIECLACDIACYFHGAGGGYVDLPVPGLEEYRRRHQG